VLLVAAAGVALVFAGDEVAEREAEAEADPQAAGVGGVRQRGGGDDGGGESERFLGHCSLLGALWFSVRAGLAGDRCTFALEALSRCSGWNT